MFEYQKENVLSIIIVQSKLNNKEKEQKIFKYIFVFFVLFFFKKHTSIMASVQTSGLRSILEHLPQPMQWPHTYGSFAIPYIMLIQLLAALMSLCPGL